MLFLYTSNPGEMTVEDNYAEEAKLMDNIAIMSTDEFDMGNFKVKGNLEGQEVIYRGWMLTVPEYTRLHKEVSIRGGELITTPSEYIACHYLPFWYPFVQHLTTDTIKIYNDRLENVKAEDLDMLLNSGLGLEGDKYFIKDFVKSLTTGQPSTATNGKEILEVAELIKQSRGKFEGGLCIRKFENYKPGTEKRCFVYKGNPYCQELPVSYILVYCAERIPSPFFSVDVAEREDGELRVIEIGDGQVSDLKEWTPEQFAGIFK